MCVQVLGPKSTIAPCSGDDETVDITNKKKAALYMVSHKIDSSTHCNNWISQSIPCSDATKTGSQLPYTSRPDL